MSVRRPFDVLALTAPGVRGLQPYQPGKPVEALEREYGVTNAVKLASNENPAGPSPKVTEVVWRAVGDITRYPDGNGFGLKHALAGHLGVEAAQITLGNGSNDVLELVARTFASPGQGIVYSEHAFAVYPLAAQAVGARGVAVPAREWGHDLAAMAAAVDETTRVVFIANPNNPTGTWVTREALAAFLDAVPDTVIVVVDEAYFEYVDLAEYPDAVSWLVRHPNLVVTRTFSKAHGLAGLRVGYAVSSPEIAELLNRVRQPFNVNSLAQCAAVAALGDHDYVVQSRELNRAERARLCRALDDLGLAYIPSVGNFVAVDVGGPAAAVYEALLRRGVIVRPVAGYGMPSHLRVTVGLPGEDDRLLDALAASVGRGRG